MKVRPMTKSVKYQTYILPRNLAIFLKSFSLFPNVKTISKLKMEHGVELEIEKICHLCSHSLDNAKFGHFTLILQRNLQRFITHLYSHCSAY